MERMDQTDDEVDFRPRRPFEGLRRVDLGVSGEGESDCLLYALDVAIRGGGFDGVESAE